MKIEYFILSIIGGLVILATVFAFFSGKTQAINRQTLLDVNQVTNVLKIYYEENGFYPYGNGVPNGINEYLEYWPEPKITESCTISSYVYTQKLGGDDYTLNFCLSEKIDGLNPGPHTATARGIL